MKVTFIVPKWQIGLWSVKMFNMPNLGLLTLAALTPPDVEVELIDENIEDIEYKHTDLVGISSMTSSIKRAYDIANKYREMGIQVVMGGIHPSVMPQEASKHADSVVIGEADDIWPLLIQDFKKRKLKKYYMEQAKPDITKLPIPRRDLLKRNRYVFPGLIQTTRGCPYNCDFCSVSKFNGRLIRTKKVDQVIAEIDDELKREEEEKIKRLKWKFARWLTKRYIFFSDDNIVANRNFAAMLFKELISLNINWGSQCCIDIAKDDELLKLASKSGCKALFIGFESLAQESLQEINKGKSYKVEEYEMLIKKIHDHGIAIETSFIFGFDEDNLDVFNRTVDFCIKNNIQVAQFSILAPLPGTKLFEKLKNEGRIFTLNWELYDVFHVVFQPKQMTAHELQKGIEQVYKDFYSFSSISKRIISMANKMKKYTIASAGINLDFHNFKF